jgi:hypothetical protein
MGVGRITKPESSAMRFEIEGDETVKAVATVAEDDIPIGAERDERAFDDDESNIHDPVITKILMQAIYTLEDRVSTVKEEMEGDIEKEPHQYDAQDFFFLNTKKELMCNQRLNPISLDQEELQNHLNGMDLKRH